MSQINFKSCGIIGHQGMVGGSAYRYYTKRTGFDVYGYSLDEQQKEAFTANIILVCVPTPYDWKSRKFNDDAIHDVLNKIQEANKNRNEEDRSVVVVKSTVTIGSIDSYQKKYSDLKILFNPEFLSEATRDADFRNPDRQYVGYTEQSYDVAKAVLNFLPLSPYGIILPAKEAELLKYINNVHGALSVIEANHYYDVCQKEELDYERVIKAAEASKWMNSQYHNINHKGFRGFGGSCFPKDINAWIDYIDSKKIDSRLMTTVRDINIDLLKAQGMTEPDAEKKG